MNVWGAGRGSRCRGGRVALPCASVDPRVGNAGRRSYAFGLVNVQVLRSRSAAINLIWYVKDLLSRLGNKS